MCIEYRETGSKRERFIDAVYHSEKVSMKETSQNLKR